MVLAFQLPPVLLLGLPSLLLDHLHLLPDHLHVLPHGNGWNILHLRGHHFIVIITHLGNGCPTEYFNGDKAGSFGNRLIYDVLHLD